MTNVITITDLGIKFKMEKLKRSRMQDFFIDRIKHPRKPSREFWALRHVSFTVERGDTVGIIGKNGSGKSTLLRVIAGIFPPDEGIVSIVGEVSTLFTLGAGFQPELSGRDNIFMDGIMMGLNKKQVNDIIESVIEFADIGDFIDMPVRTYSSGMRSRLGFSIAMSIDRDIVLIDEILGAGDASFREKANQKMDRILGGKTVVIVSHSMPTIKKFANKVIWLDKGIVAAAGNPDTVIDQYFAASNIKKPLEDDATSV
jgi:ABC-type polysaccharide/polyol phosphate transport system ATPase subunit